MKFLRRLTRSAIVFAFSVVTIASSLGTAAVSTPTAPLISAGPGHNVSRPVSPQLRARFNQLSNTSTGNGSNSSVTYYNWSGYAATSSVQPFLQVQSTFVQPTVTCTVPGAWTLFWVGFDGFDNGTVEQAGTAAQCGTSIKSAPTYYAWWEMYPTNTIQIMPLTIKPRNNIQATVTYVPQTAAFQMNITNNSTKKQYTETATCAAGLTCARDSAEWIVERPTVAGVYTPLANWSAISLTNDEAANTTTTKTTGKGSRKVTTTTNTMQPISAFGNNTPINMVDYPTATTGLASVGALNRVGNAFTDSWLAAQ